MALLRVFTPFNIGPPEQVTLVNVQRLLVSLVQKKLQSASPLRARARWKLDPMCLAQPQYVRLVAAQGPPV